MRVVILFSILFLFWLLLSGIYNSLTIFLGFFSCLLVVWFSIRLDVIDHEGHPIHLALKAITGYWPWLSKEIFISGIYVSRVILNPKLKISPKLDLIPMSQSTDVGKTTYANSITLTPGTLSIEIKKNYILVHALEASSLDHLKEGLMDKKVRDFERVL